MRRHRPALLAFLFTLVANPARAAEPAPGEQSTPDEMLTGDEKLARGKALYAEGLKQFNAGRYDAALTAYQRAYSLTSAPGLLYNIGQVYRRKAAWTDAAAYYERYLAADPGGKLVDEARARLTEVRARIADKATPAHAPEPSPPPRRDPRRWLRKLFALSAGITVLTTLGLIYSGSQVLSLEDDIRAEVGRWDYDRQAATFPDDVCREAALVGHDPVSHLCDRRDSRVLQTNLLIGASVVGLAVSAWLYYRGWSRGPGPPESARPPATSWIAPVVSPDAGGIQAVVTF